MIATPKTMYIIKNPPSAETEIIPRTHKYKRKNITPIPTKRLIISQLECLFLIYRQFFIATLFFIYVLILFLQI